MVGCWRGRTAVLATRIPGQRDQKSIRLKRAARARSRSAEFEPGAIGQDLTQLTAKSGASLLPRRVAPMPRPVVATTSKTPASRRLRCIP